MTGRAGRVGLRLLRWLSGAVVGLVSVLLLAAGTLAWRVSEGPVDVTAAAGWLLRTQAPEATLGRVTLAAGAGGRSVRLEAADVADVGGRGGVGGSLRRLTADLAAGPLLRGEVVPQDVTVDGLHVRLARSAFGGADQGGPPNMPAMLAGLRHVSLTDAEVDVADLVPGQAVRLLGMRAAIDRAADGTLRGEAAAEAAAAGQSVHLAVQASQDADGTRVTLDTSPASPAALAQADPALAPLAALDADVTLRAEASFDPGLALRHATLHAQSGPGTVQLPAKGGGTGAAHFAAMTLDAEGDTQAVTLHGLRLVLAPPSGSPPTTLVLSGDAARQGGRFTAHVAIDVDRLLAADLAGIWPAGVGGQSRAWLTENVTAGLVHDGHIAFTLAGSTTDADDLDLTEAEGGLTGDDVTVWWLRPVPPVEHAHVAAAWQDPDTMLLTITGARQGAIASRGATVRLTGLAGNHQFAFITADLAAPLRDVVAILRHPRLQLLSKHPIPIGNPAGQVTDRLTVKVPLEASVSIDQVPIHSTGQVADAHLGGIVAGRDLDRGQLAVDVTNDGLSVSGTADVDHVPGKLAVTMDFRAGPPGQVVQHATVSLRLTERDARRAGAGEIGLDAGVVLADVDYAERRDGGAAIRLHANLTEAGFRTPLGWSKTVGSAGHVDAQATLAHGRLVALDGVRAEAPGLSVAVRTEVVAGRPAVVHIERGEIGRTSAVGSVALPAREGEPYRVVLSGRQLDLEGRLDTRPQAATPGRSSAAGLAYTADLRFDRVLLGPGRTVGPLTAAAHSDGKRLLSARLALAGADPALVTLSAAGDGRELHVEAADLGRLLRAADLASALDGGALRIDGRFEDTLPSSPFDGTLDLRSFRVRGAPVVGKVLQGLTLYGLVDALRGPGLSFDRLATPLRLDGSVVEVKDARAFSSSLGFTATGRLDFGRKLVALNGTIVPAYFFNALPGRIPLVGRLFRTEKGTGLFAANYALTGALADPSVSVNPLSALTPGFARRFFDLFD